MLQRAGLTLILVATCVLCLALVISLPPQLDAPNRTEPVQASANSTTAALAASLAPENG
jgi:hypothetical protein